VREKQLKDWWRRKEGGEKEEGEKGGVDANWRKEKEKEKKAFEEKRVTIQRVKIS
jgi:hypothetical protein